MAIEFLNKVDFNQNELDKARVVNEINDAAAGTGVEGQLYFDTTADALKIWANGAWVEVGATSGVETLDTTNGTYISLTPTTPVIGDVVITADLSATDGTALAATKFLTKDNKWATVPQGDITDVAGGTYINIDDPTGPIPTVNHDLTTRTDTTSTVTAASFPVVNTITTNTTGHITAIDIKTVTVPDNNTTYDLTVPASTTDIRLVGSDSTNDDVTISGTTGQTAVTRINATELRVALTSSITVTDDVTLGDDLTVGGVVIQQQAGELNTFASEIQVPAATASGNATNLGQVQGLIAGIGMFQGGYDASTDPGVPIITGAANIALDQGDFYVVTVAGTFFTEDVEPGDMIFANANIAANSSPVLTDFTVVISDANVAGEGATDGATDKGVAGFDSASFNVTANGWVTLDKLANPYGASILLTGGSDSGGQTTFTVDITALFGATALAKNCKAEIVTEAGRQTVYPDITGNGTGSMDFKFIPVVADGVAGTSGYRALISIM